MKPGSSSSTMSGLKHCSSSRSIGLRYLQSSLERLKDTGFSTYFPVFPKFRIPLKDPWVKENGAVKEVVLHFSSPEVEAGFEDKPCFEEAFYEWKV